MTPEEHNKYVGISHLVYGGFMALICLGMIGLFIGVFSSIPEGPPPAVILFMTIFIGGLYSLMTIPSLVAGYGLLKHKHWARTAAIIGAVTAAMNFHSARQRASTPSGSCSVNPEKQSSKDEITCCRPEDNRGPTTLRTSKQRLRTLHHPLRLIGDNLRSLRQ